MESLMENLGFPTHKQKIPPDKVPMGEKWTKLYNYSAQNNWGNRRWEANNIRKSRKYRLTKSGNTVRKYGKTYQNLVGRHSKLSKSKLMVLAVPVSPPSSLNCAPQNWNPISENPKNKNRSSETDTKFVIEFNLSRGRSITRSVKSSRDL